ncbi:MAG: ABC transporter ATP-binding protein [Gemmatimonadaceae bacterium]|nr:ABC transporter ATP-binding protein [Gemmatimonadaceae bacterium]
MLVELESACKVYRKGPERVRALWEVDAAFGEGEFVALMGPSGSGKTTLLNIIGCLDNLTAGRYLLEGQDVTRLNPIRLAEVRNRRIGFVFQGFHLLPRATAAENVQLPLVYAGATRRRRRESAHAALERVGLADRRDFRPEELSGGQRQRVAIARALVNEPSLILADEPTGSLDPQAAGEVMELFARLNDDGIAIVLVTHQEEVARLARRKIHLADGRVVPEPAGPASPPQDRETVR